MVLRISDMKTYLVTGGAGFIGSHLVDALLAAGHHVLVLDDLSTGKRDNLDPRAMLTVGSITDGPLVDQLLSKCDGCFHLAAIASVERCTNDWVASHQVNMTGAVCVMDAAAMWKIPVVYASSAAVYGDASACPIAETAPMQPLSAYGADKRGIELHAQVAWSVYGVPNVGLRFFNVYGKRQDPHSSYSGVISIFAERIAKAQEITIFGSGRQTRDFIHVDDVVHALTLAMKTIKSGAEIFNVCTGRETSLLELAQTIGEIVEVKPQVAFAPSRTGDIERSVGDPSLLQTRIGFKPSISLAEGLALSGYGTRRSMAS